MAAHMQRRVVVAVVGGGNTLFGSGPAEDDRSLLDSSLDMLAGRIRNSYTLKVNPCLLYRLTSIETICSLGAKKYSQLLERVWIVLYGDGPFQLRPSASDMHEPNFGRIERGGKQVRLASLAAVLPSRNHVIIGRTKSHTAPLRFPIRHCSLAARNCCWQRGASPEP